MRKILLLIGIWIPILSQSQTTDDFSDGDFTVNPHWSGDSAHFEINSVKQLHLKSAGADTSYLSTGNSSIMKTEWEFWFKLSFNTSSNNYFRIYLTSDRENLKGPLNGYFIRIGGSDDSLAVIRQTGKEQKTVFHGRRVCTNHSTNVIRLRVLHDPGGKWEVYSDDTGENNFLEEGSFFDSAFTHTSWFGIFCRYTASNAAKFYFDDLYIGPIRTDTVPPVLEYVNTLSSKELELVFSENLDQSAAGVPENYHTSKGLHPVTAWLDPDNARRVLLEFPVDFTENVPDTLYVSGIGDLWGNRADTLKAVFAWFRLHPWDILITEIMADPDPPVGLPPGEYVELFNRTQFPVGLKGWEFSYGSTKRKFPDVFLEAGKYLILSCDPVWDNYGKSVRIFTSATSLSNEGSTLVLKDNDGKIIHSVSYSKEWYKDKIKAEGGWSLEMIDPGNPCGCSENWMASMDKRGGTPGGINSVNGLSPDRDPPRIERLYPVSPDTLEVIFTEPMDSTSLAGPEQWELDGGIGIPGSQKILPPDYRILMLSSLSAPLTPEIIYHLSSSGGPRDCAGNELNMDTEARVALPGMIDPGNIVFNEILPDPYPDGSRFIEIYNRSDKVLDLKEMEIGNLDTLTGSLVQPCTLAGSGFLLFPGDYLVLTKDPEDIMSRYVTPGRSAFLQMQTFPRMNNEGESLGLARISDGMTIDRMAYSDGMQFPLFTSTEGISLEKVHPNLPSEIKSSWHSASGNCRFATPGYRNSQFLMISGEPEETVSAASFFSPDNDGNEDVLAIRIHTDNPGYTAQVVIFDSQGRRICQPARNLYIGTDEVILWDGLTETGRKAVIGQYILFTELISRDGKVSHFKKVVTLGGRH